MVHTVPQGLPCIPSAADIIPTMEEVLEQQRAVRNAIVQNVTTCTACFENAIRPIIDVENRTQGKIAAIAMLRYASPSEAARKASDAAIGLMREAEAEFTSRTELFAIFKAVSDKGEQLDLESARYLEEMIKDFVRCGHGRLNQDQISLYLENRNKIDALRRTYNSNVRNDDDGLWFSLDELQGVPEQDLRRLLGEGRPGDRNDDPEKVEQRAFARFNGPDVKAVLQYATRSDTRKKIYVANEKRLAVNVPIFKEIIVLRDQNARLLGYESHAAFRLENRMVKSPRWVEDLLDELEEVLLPQGQKAMEPLLMKRQILDPLGASETASMPPWDFDYYSRICLADLQIDQSVIKEYFPLDYAIAAMLRLFEDTLQLDFRKVDDAKLNASTWHADVTAYSVWDKRNQSQHEFVGFLYLDIFARPSKHRGSQNVNLQCSYVAQNGTRVYPATILMCSFPRSTASPSADSVSQQECALLQHSELVSLFHELGHGMHDLVARTQYARLHGHRSPPDFAEIPSVMLENWCWLREELQNMSCHVKTLRAETPNDALVNEKTIPNDILDGLIESRHLSRAAWFLRQLAFARFDMAVHNPKSPEDCLNLDPAAIFNNFMEKLQLLPCPDPEARGHPQANFHHLVSGMDAGYYSFLRYTR